MEHIGNGEHWRPKHPMHVSNNDCGDYSVQHRLLGNHPPYSYESVIIFKGDVIYRGEYEEICKLWDELVFDLTTPKQECVECLKKDVQIVEAKRVSEMKSIVGEQELKDIIKELTNSIRIYERCQGTEYKCPCCGWGYSLDRVKMDHRGNCEIGMAMSKAREILE